MSETIYGESLYGNPILIIIALFTALFALLWGPPGYARAEEFPGEIAGIKLVKQTEGDEAKRMTYDLHGKDLDLEEAFMLHYGNPREASGTATIWISRSRKEETSRDLEERMVEGIRGGAGPYGHFKELVIDDTSVVSLYGSGKRHYIYRKGRDLVWIEVSYDKAEPFLKEWLEKLK